MAVMSRLVKRQIIVRQKISTRPYNIFDWESPGNNSFTALVYAFILYFTPNI